jgi:chromosome segregation ATPase
MASSVAIGGFSVRIVIGEELFEFQNFSDIENLPREKAVQILEHLLFVERPALFLEASKVPNLQQNLKKLVEDKEFLFRKTQSIEYLSAKILEYHKENQFLQKEVLRLTKDVEDVNQDYLEVSTKLSVVTARYDDVSTKLSVITTRYDEVSAKLSVVTARLDEVIQPISARQIATDADEKAIKTVFPMAKKRPYCIRSFSNLREFLQSPQDAVKKQLCYPDANDAWLKLSEKEREAIKERLRLLEIAHPKLGYSIKEVKDNCWRAAHTISVSATELVKSFSESDEEDLAESVQICDEFICERM